VVAMVRLAWYCVVMRRRGGGGVREGRGRAAGGMELGWLGVCRG